MKSENRKKLVVTAVAIVAVAAVLTAVFLNKTGNRFTLSAEAKDLMEGVKPQATDVSGAVSDGFVNSTQSFSVDLFKNSYRHNQNTLVSPVSASFALTMTANGASGTTLDAFEKLLGKYGLTVTDLDKACKAYKDELTQKRGNTTFNISNSIWIRKGLPVKKPFLQANADYFGAQARALDFNDQNSVNIINSWVKNATGGKIDKIIEKINPQDMMHLMNALSLDAKWQNAFDTKSVPYGDLFHFEDGGLSKATYMSLEAQLDYIKGVRESAVLLPYDDGRLAMLCILPNEGTALSDYIANMNEKTIPQLLAAKNNTDVSVTLPQFRVESANTLDDSLKAMGLSIAYAYGKADFSKMSDSALCVSTVLQKTFLQVDELGTQAGAVTDVVMDKSCAFAVPRLVFNRPFVYAILDTKTSLPLFIGAMENPISTLAAQKDHSFDSAESSGQTPSSQTSE